MLILLSCNLGLTTEAHKRCSSLCRYLKRGCISSPIRHPRVQKTPRSMRNPTAGL